MATGSDAYPENTGEVLIRLVGLDTEPDLAIVGFIVRGSDESPFTLVRRACQLVGDRLQGLGPCEEIRTECMGGPWHAEITEEGEA